MSEAVAAAAKRRGERQRAQTRAALIKAAQRLLAEDRTSVPVLEITELAGVGIGSFYNHFTTKEDLFQAAVDDALELQGALLDAWGDDLEDPAEVFARSFRLVGRLHRLEPRYSRVILSQGLGMLSSDRGLAPRARRDIERACAAGRFTSPDTGTALLIVGGAAMAVGQTIHDHPELDDAALTDDAARHLLRMLGLSPSDADDVCSRPLPKIAELWELASTAAPVVTAPPVAATP